MARGQDEITNREDLIDSRDVIERIDYLESERESYSSQVDDMQNALDEAESDYASAESDQDVAYTGAKVDEAREALAQAKRKLAEWDASDEADELKALKELQDEAEGYSPDWRYGATLIRDSYFTDYAEELCKDIGDMPKEIPSYIVIDWEATAENLKVDYTSVEFDGVDYCNSYSRQTLGRRRP